MDATLDKERAATAAEGEDAAAEATAAGPGPTKTASLHILQTLWLWARAAHHNTLVPVTADLMMVPAKRNDIKK